MSVPTAPAPPSTLLSGAPHSPDAPHSLASLNAASPSRPCICIRLRRIAQKVTDLYDKALAPLGITINQYSLLVNIHRHEGCGTGELAQHVGLEKSTLVRSLAPLFKAGLIEDRATPCGRGSSRRRRLYLSERGQAVLHQARPLWNQTQEQVAGRLGISHDALMELFAAVDAWE